MKFLYILKSSLFSVPLALTLSVTAMAQTPMSESMEQGDPVEMERNRLLGILSKEVDANLMAKDKKKLNRNVMALGSYRHDWSEKSEEFLVTNATLSELYLYKYAMVKNQRLNDRIVHALLGFKRLRYPKAPMAFSDFLGHDPQSKAAVLGLFQKAVQESPSLWPDYLNLVFGDWGRDLALEERLSFVLSGCAVWRQASPDTREALQTWVKSARGFWDTFIAKELSVCIQDL